MDRSSILRASTIYGAAGQALAWQGQGVADRLMFVSGRYLAMKK